MLTYEQARIRSLEDSEEVSAAQIARLHKKIEFLEGESHRDSLLVAKYRLMLKQNGIEY